METVVHHSFGNILLRDFCVLFYLRAVNNEFVAAFVQLFVVQDGVIFA